jgi:type IV pilus assembly protein PilA
MPPNAAAPKRGLSGCAIAAIVLVGLAVLAIPILGILAAIAIPQYQEYVQRAKVQQAVVGVRALLPALEAYALENGACPDNAALGVGQGGDGRFGPSVGMVVIGADREGACSVELGFVGLSPGAVSSDVSVKAAPGAPSMEQSMPTLLYRKAGDSWDCTGGSLNPRYRPNECRTTPR